MQAVAGIVGHAELLCVSLSIPALLLYFSAADNDAADTSLFSSTTSGPGSATAGPSGAAEPATATSLSIEEHQRLAVALHWARVILAALLTWAAALSKEIGITVVGAMLAYDLLLVPAVRGSTGGTLLWQRKWGRMLLMCIAGVLYVKLRGWVAVDQLVRIYRKVGGCSVDGMLMQLCCLLRRALAMAVVSSRAVTIVAHCVAIFAVLSAVHVKLYDRPLASRVSTTPSHSVLLQVCGHFPSQVENPIPFAPSIITRVATTGYLHALYAGLLVWPVRSECVVE